jgi:hypothetical protein
MLPCLERVQRMLRRRPPDASTDDPSVGQACAWDAMRATYEEQAQRGVTQAIEGLERIRQDRWPTSGRVRRR